MLTSDLEFCSRDQVVASEKESRPDGKLAQFDVGELDFMGLSSSIGRMSEVRKYYRLPPHTLGISSN